MKKIYILWVFVLALVAASCAKQDTVYKEFVKNGGFIYPAKPINISADCGFQRIVLTWELPMDPSILTAKLFWDSRTQSLDFDYADYPDGKVSVVIPNLEDRSYTFEVVNYDSSDNASLATEITASPFGDSWLVSHAERAIKMNEMDGTDAVITLGKPTNEIASTKFRYLNNSGQTVEKVFPASETVVRLPDAQQWKYVEYQSSFCPAEGIDTVWISNWSKGPYPVASTVESTSTVTVTANQVRDNYVPSYIIDGIKDDGDKRWFSSQSTTYRGIFPKIIVIDTKRTGAEAMHFNHFVFYEDPAEDAQTRRWIRTVAVYVTDTKPNPDDASYAAHFGTPVLEATLNQNYAEQGFELQDEAIGRYVAIVFKNSYNSVGFLDLWEFEAFGYVKQ